MMITNNQHKDNTWVYIFIAVVAALVILAFTSCYNQQKAAQQFSRAAIAYPLLPANYCAVTYPVHTVTDSTEYKNSKRIIDSLASALINDSLLSDDERQRLIIEIERVRNLIVESKNCDSLSDAIYKLANKEKVRGDKLQTAYNNLLIASQNLKPVHDTTENTAKLQACQLERQTTLNLLSDSEKERKIAQGKAKTRGIFMWSFIALIICYSVWKLYGMFKPKLK